MRHTLMHTGALRFLYDEKNETGHLADLLRRHVSQFRGHYTLTVEIQYQDVLRAAVNGKITTVKALNVQLTAFAADILRVAKDYAAETRKDPTLQSNCELVYPTVRVQQLKIP